MAIDPERPIEKLLRAAARKRREQASESAEFGLHPATRRWLQAEVAQRFKATVRPTGRVAGGWLRLWPKFAWSFGAVAILGLAATLLLHQPQTSPAPTILAKNEPAAAPAPLPPAAAPVSAPAEPGVARDEAPTAGRGQPTSYGLSAKGPAPAAPAANVPAAAGLAQSKADSGLAGAVPLQRRRELVSAAEGLRSELTSSSDSLALVPGSATAVPHPEVAAGSRGSQPSSTVQAYTQMGALAQSKALRRQVRGTVTPVLVSFQIEQTGREVRVLDSDGSVYTGTLTNGEYAEKDKRARQESKAVLGRPGDGTRQMASFLVVGTNLTLKQQVVFSASLPTTNQAVGQSAFGRANSVTGGISPLLLPNASLSGKAWIGSQEPIEINAEPVPK